MTTRDHGAFEQGGFEGFDAIPDPAAGVARQPAPDAAPPAEPSLTRADRRRRTVLALALAVGWIGLVLVYREPRRDIGAVEVAIPVAAWVVFGAAALLVSLKPGARGLPPALRVVQVIVAAVPVLFVAMALAVTDATKQPEPLGGCLTWAGISAAGPLVLLAVLLRRSFLSAPVWRGAAIGAATGLCAAAAVHAHCSSVVSAHVVIAHGFPIAAGAVLGALFGALRGRA